MFATLVGSDRDTTVHDAIAVNLVALAAACGYTPPDTQLHIEPDQTPLREWRLDYRGPADKRADFFLAVTAPAVPGISPIPAMKTVSGPMFAVTCMEHYFGIWRETTSGRGEFTEVNTAKDVYAAFGGWLGERGPA